MWSKAKDAELMAIKRKDFLEKGFELFSTKNIDTVTLTQVAEAAGYGIATLYRYFKTKQDFVVEVATRKWEQFQEEYKESMPQADNGEMAAAERFAFYLESFLELYRKHSDLLRFNQFFNVYVRDEHVDAGTLQPYRDMIANLRERFHAMYLKAAQDKTLRTDVPEEEMFSTSLHLMLAAVTRYAVGLVYIPENVFDAEKELKALKEMLLDRYRVH